MLTSPPIVEGHASAPPRRAFRPVILGEGYEGRQDIFFAAVQLTRMPMILTDPNQEDNPIVFANSAFVNLVGYEPSEIIGRNCRFLQGKTTDKGVIAAIHDSVLDEREFSGEILNYRKDGSAFWNALFVSPVYDVDGKLIYFFASQLDVSRRHDAEEALRQAQKMETVGQLTGGIAHDFNNNLTVIMSSLNSARDLDISAMREGDQRKMERYLDRALAAGERSNKLTSQLLAFARRTALDTRATNLNGLAKTMRDIAEPTLGAEIDIILDEHPEIWIADVDYVHAENAILNIMINARDAMPEGGSITLKTRNEDVGPEDIYELEAGRYSVLSVEDTGEGIPADLLTKVTEPFFTTKDVGKGTGMGLAMVHGFMKQSRGHLGISSEVGKGTRVDLYFPAAAGAHKVLEPMEKRGPKGGEETILLVEDNANVMEAAVDLLADLGYRVVTAPSAQSALRRFADGLRPDLLLSDIKMPGGMNGISLAQQFKSLHPSVRVLLCTGHAQELSDRNRNPGFEILKKPYRKGELERKVREILDGPTGVD